MGYRVEEKQVTSQRRVVVGAVCDRCQKEIPNLKGFDEEHYHPTDALSLTLHGFYGGFFDCDQDPLGLLCRDCARDLCKAFPFIEALIRSTDPLEEEDDA